MATKERNNVDPHAAAEFLRAALSDVGLVLASRRGDPVSPTLRLVELGRVRSDVAVRLAEAIRRGRRVMPEEQQPEGALVVDTERDKLGYVMGHFGRVVQLRPVTGGREWDVDPAHVRRATDEERQQAMRERTRALNLASSGGVFS